MLTVKVLLKNLLFGGLPARRIFKNPPSEVKAMRDEDKDLIRDAELQVEQTVLQQVVAAVPAIMSGVFNWCKSKLGMTALLALALLPQVLFAADALPSGQDLLGEIISGVILPAAASVLLLVLTRLAAMLKRKTGIEISQRIIDEAVHYAEAAGNAYLLERGAKMPAAVSQQLAIEYATEHGGKRVCGQSLSLLRNRIDAAVQRCFNQDRDYKLKYSIDSLAHKYRRPEPEHIDDNQTPVPTGVTTPFTSDTTGD